MLILLVLENTSTNSKTRRRKDEDEQRHCPGFAGARGSEVRLLSAGKGVSGTACDDDEQRHSATARVSRELGEVK
jgi:hypothetical protein